MFSLHSSLKISSLLFGIYKNGPHLFTDIFLGTLQGICKALSNPKGIILPLLSGGIIDKSPFGVSSTLFVSLLHALPIKY